LASYVLSARFYYENAHADAATESATVSIGSVRFVGGRTSIRRFVDCDHENVVSWHEFVPGGHYSVPDVLVGRVDV
jgi:hypothetical protein